MKELLDGFSVDRLEALISGNFSFEFGQRQEELANLARIALAVKQAQPFGYVYSSKDGGAVNFDYKLPLMPERWDIVPVFAHPQASRVRVARVPTASQLEAMKELTDFSQELESRAAEGQKQEGDD